jgi:2,4-dienoyl-CoA reductase-like NADH-dependent reductase (Old Yellow Enzyme family)
VESLPELFASAAERADRAGFDVVELHAAHGYLLHQFLSPLSNQRCDRYGGDYDGRLRVVLDVVAEVRRRLPEDKPLLMRVSATDWTPGGWDVDQTVELARRVSRLGVDLVDVSTGGNVPAAAIPVGPGYQVPFSAQIRREAGVPTAAVGLVTTPQYADRVLREGDADAIMIGRPHLEDPYWVRHAAHELGIDPSAVHIAQYDRAELGAGRYASKPHSEEREPNPLTV